MSDDARWHWHFQKTSRNDGVMTYATEFSAFQDSSGTASPVRESPFVIIGDRTGVEVERGHFTNVEDFETFIAALQSAFDTYRRDYGECPINEQDHINADIDR